MKSKLLLTLGLSVVFVTPIGSMAVAAPQTGIGQPPSKDAKAYPDQSTVAAKKLFANAPISAAKGALGAKSMADAQKMIGKAGAFQGTVSGVYSPKGHDVVILDFDPNYREALTAIVRPADYAKLPNLASLKGKHVLVSGKFEAYKGKPEIEIASASQIKLLP